MPDSIPDRISAQDSVRRLGLRPGVPMARLLMDAGAASPRQMLTALGDAKRTGASLDQVMLSQGLASPEDTLASQAVHHGVLVVDPVTVPPDPTLAGMIDPEFSLQHAFLPWARIGDTVLIATARPEEFAATCARLPTGIGPLRMALALESDLQAVIAERHAHDLARAAETWVRAEESCRDFRELSGRRLAVLATAGGGMGLALILWPQLFFAVAVGLAMLSLIVSQILKIAAAFAGQAHVPPDNRRIVPARYPMVSVLVPLLHEKDIASTLIRRLSRLSYPKSRLEVLLVLEAADDQTKAVLAHTNLPGWMRVIEVPPGSVTTKPRALNYAYRFSKGEIVGIYDAEDAPDPHQLELIAARFETAPPEVACLQGALDFYNPRANWLSRCFTIEYAAWFRVLLPGLARLGFAIPLGGTTVFFRRHVLEEVRGWDAHNVTEDADLGIRLARYGYRTEVVPTVTREEANNRPLSWVKQRSRWLKGYLVTYLVHMRSPRRLLSDLGPWKFAGMQAVFLTTILQFTLAPLLWSFWLVQLDLTHPAQALQEPVFHALLALFLLSEGVSLLVGSLALVRSPHIGLIPWVPTLILYFPLAVAAAYKAWWELLADPFFWDKTTHGRSGPDPPA
ncbi:glycosyltransferase family 2 protein [Mesobacterium sp. TK19101]|uniref:Glycosyltransferase family 2 protein n=1 Tax=Mesobacterium hydrothermale TaxID=3111907 RepID=A0ABU6HF38_9RHOB|nr:glycosyltransferase family 2 protein [Mesobacterium sp. TK19101]MEC3861052.1 glycosyltransferase family 2 protein [Mesobacterium sp. TK19101]